MKFIKICAFVAVCLLCCLFIGCSDVTGEIPDEEEKPTEFSVTFMSEGKKYHGAVISSGNPVAKPINDPEKSSYKFLGWYTAENGGELYDFKTPITKSIVIYARFELDMELIESGISNIKSSIIKVTNKNYNVDKDGKETDVLVEEGIGVIFNISNGYFFSITNHHITERKNGFNHQKVTVEDSKGRKYDGLFYDGKGYKATSSDYDLSIVCCVYNKTDLTVAPMKRQDPSVEDMIVAVGIGENELSVGTIEKLDLATVPMEEYLSNVTFKVIHHDATVESQESLLFSLDMGLVGITYANDNGANYAIPASRINDFLYAFVYQ